MKTVVDENRLLHEELKRSVVAEILQGDIEVPGVSDTSYLPFATGYPLNRENGNKKNPCQEKHREFGNFAKTPGIWFAQVVNSLILKVKDIFLPRKFLKFSIYF